MTRALGTIVVMFSLVAAGAALATDESALRAEQGKLLLNDGHYNEALQQFADAVAADPTDMYALYYKGLTEAHLENWDAAVTDLRKVMEAPADVGPDALEGHDRAQGALTLGVALVKTGRYDDAPKWLTQAQQVSDLDAAASFYLGLVQLRRGELAAARKNLERAGEKDPQYIAACRYYLGIVELESGDRETAKRLFESVVATSPGIAVGQAAHNLLVRLQAGGTPSLRPYQLYAGGGLEYDSNVVLAPLNDEAGAGFGKQSDGRGIIVAGGSYTLWRTEQVQLTATYDFFQSLHFNLTQFNIQDHRPGFSLTGRAGWVEGGVLAAYDYYLQETNSFMQQGEAFPWVRVSEPGFGRTDVFYRMQRRDFKQAVFQNALDSFTHMAGVDQFMYLGAPERYVVVGYRFDTMVPVDGAVDVFAYDGNQVRAGIGWTLPFGIPTAIDYAFRRKNYASASAGGVPGALPVRDDSEHRVIFSMERQLADYTSLTLAYFGTFNQSNQAVFEYNRNIVSLSVEVRY